MLKLPQSIIYAIVAVNISGFAILLQLDMLNFNSLWEKLMAWALTTGVWVLAYASRKKYVTLF